MKRYLLPLPLAIGLTLTVFAKNAFAENGSFANRPMWTDVYVCLQKTASCVDAYQQLLKIGKEYDASMAAFNKARNSALDAVNKKSEDIRKQIEKLPESDERSAMLENAEKIASRSYGEADRAMAARKETQVYGAHKKKLPLMNELMKKIPEIAKNPIVLQFELLTGSQADLRMDDLALSPFVRSITFPDMNLTRNFECLDDDRRKDPTPLKFEDKKYEGYVALIVDYNRTSDYGQKANTLSFRIVNDTNLYNENHPTRQGAGCSIVERDTE